MEKLKEIIKLCNASVEVMVNYHKDHYMDIEDYISGHLSESIRKKTSPRVLEEMIHRDTFIRIQAYPTTPVSCYVVYHYDLDMALEEMLHLIKEGK